MYARPMQRKIFLCSIIFFCFLSPVSGYHQQTPANQPLIDFDPFTDVNVTFTVTMIRSLEKYDEMFNIQQELRRLNTPSFYVTLWINNDFFQSHIWWNTPYISAPNWSATANVPDTEEFVHIRIQLLDRNEIAKNHTWDIMGYPKPYEATINYSIKTGQWTGDDHLGDPSGYGRLNGNDDKLYKKRTRVAELWFDITQTDPDGDRIPSWIEMNSYGTNPLVNDTGADLDYDDTPIEWEHHWGYNPLITDDHDILDPDNDGLSNIEEYLTSQWGSDPFRRDIFTEMDIMENGSNGEIVTFPELSKELIRTAFNRRNIVYHLDDGQMGGGERLPFSSVSTDENIRGYYRDYFLHGNMNNWRRGVFHYGMVIYNAKEVPGYTFQGDNKSGFNAFQISALGMEKKASLPHLNREVVYASAYMHETGHTLGFFLIPGHNRFSKSPLQLGWWLSRPYRSCMNYGYIYTMVDYSDGSLFIRDLNDWRRLDLTFFEKGFG